MSVRIISGSLRGRVLQSPVGAATRPTTDMWRSAVFSVLEHLTDLENATVLDLCCGTGAFGFECLSRGSSKAVFVDSKQSICNTITAAAKEFDVSSAIEVYCMDMFDYLRTTQVTFDIIFADPPYPLKAGNKILHQLAINSSLITHYSLLILEHGDTEALLPHSNLERVWYKESSRTVVEMFRRQAPKP